MSDKSRIEWTDATWNPMRGCSRVSEGCRNCYAERVAARFSGSSPSGIMRAAGRPQKVGEVSPPFAGFAYPTKAGPRWTGRVELIPEKLDEPLRWKKPRRIFVNSMSDLFHERLSDEAIAAVFGAMAAAPQHTFQVLTKRPDRMRRWFDWVTRAGHGLVPAWYVTDAYKAAIPGGTMIAPAIGRALAGTQRRLIWPLPNVWLGVSVEDQETADDRIPLLLQTPAALRFVSYEPALGPVDWSEKLGAWTRCGDCGRDVSCDEDGCCSACGGDAFRFGLDWLIVGGESGPGARPFDVAWARSAVAQCKAAGVPVFVKQLGARPTGEPWLKANGKWVQQHHHPARRNEPVLNDRKGGDPSEWPEDLRVREFPETNAA